MSSPVPTMLAWVLLGICLAAGAEPLGSAFTYQGELNQNGNAANGDFDFEFLLFDDATAGAQVGPILTVEDASVAAGIFSLELDFGTGPFAGDRLWLEIGVREGASTDPFTGLVPRQQLTAAPYALHAEMVAMDAISTNEIANNSITAADLAANSVGVSELANNAVGSAEIADGAIRSTDLARNSVGSAAIVDRSIGSADLARNSVDASALADNAVDSAAIAVGAVGSSDINASQVQRRVTGLCPSGEYLRGINQDGTVLCELVPKQQVITTLDDSVNDVGQYTSIAIGSDNLPVISYHDATAFALKVAHCTNPACTGKTITTVDDPANGVGNFTSIAIGSDNLPVISYRDFTAGALKVAHCNDVACSGNDETITTVDDPANNVGWYTSIAIGSDNLPVISYHDFTAGALKVAHCNDVACTGGDEAITTVDDANFVGAYTSIAIGSDNLPVISYYDATAGALKVAHCTNLACTGKTITTVDDPANFVGQHTSIAIGSDNLPVISYYDATANALKVAHCNDVACSGNDETITTVDDPANFVGTYTSIAIGSDNLPVISYQGPGSALNLAHCTNLTCTGKTITTVDAPAVGRFTSITIGSDNLPVISYRDDTAFALKVVRCGTPDCVL